MSKVSIDPVSATLAYLDENGYNTIPKSLQSRYPPAFNNWKSNQHFVDAVRERSLTMGGGLCFFGCPFGVGHNFMGPRLGEGYNFWAPFLKTLLGDVHKWVLCY